ncbi:MAG: glycosyl/glycerophosphate transferase [Homoserinimonas sp.]|jgi:CDP-glycerol glycerophosphotransferase|nr:glycosyl/glycerophosphate transferase [Homoserinimonas sp.]
MRDSCLIVSQFTFAAGNAKKIAAIPLYFAGAVASLVTRRRAELWVFGCGSGVGEGSLALLETAKLRNPALRIVWLARNEEDRHEATRHGVAAVLKDSWQGFRLTLRASVVVVTHGFGDVNRFATKGAFIVQLWHGIPLKRIHLDAARTFASRLPVQPLLKWAYRRASGRISLMPAASAVSAARLRTAFGLPAERVVVTGDPRDDVLCAGTPQERREAANSLLHSRVGTPPHSRVLLFAPTWRDGAADPSVPRPDEWQRIAEWLQLNDTVLVLRPHPHTVGDYEAGTAFSSRIVMLDSRAQQDITPILPTVDALITDYSSIGYDFALLARPIFFLAPDVQTYAAERGLYEPYDRFSGGHHVASWDDLLQLMSRAATDDSLANTLQEHSRQLRIAHHAFRDGKNTERVYRAIMERLPESQGGIA